MVWEEVIEYKASKRMPKLMLEFTVGSLDESATYVLRPIYSICGLDPRLLGSRAESTTIFNTRS